jgi:hypothetical protein
VQKTKGVFLGMAQSPLNKTFPIATNWCKSSGFAAAYTLSLHTHANNNHPTTLFFSTFLTKKKFVCVHNAMEQLVIASQHYAHTQISCVLSV